MIGRLLSRFGNRQVVPPPVVKRRRRIHHSGPLPLTYAIGDVHGSLDELLAAEEKIVADAAERDEAKLIVMLGDYVDRGPKSAAVLDHLIAPPPHGFRRLCLAGNHDDAMVRFVADPAENLPWLDFGGDTTLRSYGIDVTSKLRVGDMNSVTNQLQQGIPARHLQFVEKLPIMFVSDAFVFVHAGIAPGVPLEDQEDEDLMWIREPFLTEGPGLPLTVVHGHSPQAQPVFGLGRIGIDTGAYVTGRLTVLRIDDGFATVL